MDKSVRGEEQDASHCKASKGLIFLVNVHTSTLATLTWLACQFLPCSYQENSIKVHQVLSYKMIQKKKVLCLIFFFSNELFSRKLLYAGRKECLSDIVWYLTTIWWPANIHCSEYVYSVPDALLLEEEKEISESSPHPVCLTRLHLCSKRLIWLILTVSRLTEKSLRYLHHSPSYNPSDLFSQIPLHASSDLSSFPSLDLTSSCSPASKTHLCNPLGDILHDKQTNPHPQFCSHSLKIMVPKVVEQ